MKRMLSLFDHTGSWPYYFQQSGWDVIHYDLQNWISLDVNEIIDAGTALDLFEDVSGILASPPCTDFTSSGAQYWSSKDECGQTEASLELVRQVIRLADLFLPTDPDYYDEMPDATFFYCIENPVGRLSKLLPGLGKPTYFHPWEYAGYLDLGSEVLRELDRIRKKNGHGITQKEAELILATNTYTKKTGLWGDFRMPEKKPIEPVKGAPQGSVLQRFGGKSIETKNKRSATPMGFAKAFYLANVAYQATIY